MASQLVVEGPFDIGFEKAPKGAAKHIGKEHASDFWSCSDVGFLKQKQGCYIFATRAGKGFCPWYVGKATKGFKQEIFTPSKLNHYNKALWKGKKGTPVMFFVTLDGNKRKVRSDIIKDMEKFLTQSALSKNSELCNIQNTKNVPQWGIRGVIRGGQGKAKTCAGQLKKMLGL